MNIRALAVAPLIALVSLYRWLISPVLPRACRFQPTCSAYALAAWRRHGPVYGSWLSVRRVLRCHPGQPGGYDPVPGLDDDRLAMISPSAQVRAAWRRLSGVSPLAAAQAVLTADQRRAHRALLDTLARTGQAPGAAALAGDALAVLADRGLVVLADGAPVTACPVSTAVTPHRVMVSGCWVYAPGALDALALAPMLERDVQVESPCAATGTPIRIEQMNLTVLSVTPPAPLAGIVWRAAVAGAATSLGVETVLLRDQAAAHRWCDQTQAATSVFSVEDAVLLSALLFKPLVTGSTESLKPWRGRWL